MDRGTHREGGLDAATRRTPRVAGKPPEASGDKDRLSPPASEGGQATNTRISESVRDAASGSCRASSFQVGQIRTGTGTCRPHSMVTQPPGHLPSSCRQCGGPQASITGPRGQQEGHCILTTHTHLSMGPFRARESWPHASPSPPPPRPALPFHLRRPALPAAGHWPCGSSAGLWPGLVGRHRGLPPG